MVGLVPGLGPVNGSPDPLCERKSWPIALVQGSIPCTFFQHLIEKKKINVLVEECFRSVLLKPVEGMRDRWSG